MPDSVRVVTFQAGGQITEVLNLQSSLDWTINSSGFTKNSLAILRGERNQQMTSRGGRYDGEYFNGEKVSNSNYKFQVLVGGPTPDALIAKMNALYTVTERIPGPLYIEHRDEGATFPSYYEIRAPAKAQENRDWAQRMGAKSVAIDVEWPVAPLVCGAPMDITDTDIGANLGDYRFDAMTAATFPATAALTSERRLIHTARGYKQGSCQVTVSARPGATISGYKIGAIPKCAAPNTYIDVYVDDNGTDSRLRIDTVAGGARTNRFTTNLGTRISPGATIWVRGRVEDSVIYAEYFDALNTPRPMGSPTSSGSYTLISDISSFGESAQGRAGFDWIPQHVDASEPNVEVLPYTYRNRTLPDTWKIDGLVPGDASALGSVSIAIGSAALIPFAMFSWTRTSGTTANPLPFGVRDLGVDGAGGGFTDTADASCRGGRVVQTTSFAGGENCDVAVHLPWVFPDDLQTQTQMMEVWARVKVSSTLTNAALALRYSGAFTTTWSIEYGPSGKKITPPSSGTSYRFVRLGTVPMPIFSTPGDYIGVTAVGSGGGTLGLDYLILNPVQRRALTPTGKVSGPTYPNFFAGIGVVQRDILPTLNGRVSSGYAMGAGGVGGNATGMGGSLIELPAGPDLAICCKLSSMVPDDPTPSATSETLSHAAMVRLSLIPRYLNQRSD